MMEHDGYNDPIIRECARCFEKDAEIARLNKQLKEVEEHEVVLSNLKDRQVQERDDEITRLNAQINHISAKLGKEHEEHVKDLIEKDKVIRAMANEYCLEHGVVPCAQTTGDLIDSFTREQEAKDARDN